MASPDLCRQISLRQHILPCKPTSVVAILRATVLPPRLPQSFGFRDLFSGKVGAYNDIKIIDRVRNDPPKLNTAFEDNLFKHWIKGSGETYNLTDGEMEYLAQNKAVQDVGSALQDPRFGVDLSTKPIGSTVGPEISVPNSTKQSTRAQVVQLNNGERGYAVPFAFYGSVPEKGVPNPLDGSLGAATAYFSSNGQFIGVADSYDFKHDDFQDQAIDRIGSAVGAKDFLITGGIVADGNEAIKVP